MGKWLDLAARLEEEAEACANSANSANSSPLRPIGTNDTIGTGDLPAFISMGLHRLRSMRRPPLTNPAVWPGIVADALRIADEGWASRAIRLGWEPLHLFGFDPTGETGSIDLSLAAYLDGWPIVDLEPEYITLRRANVSRPFRNRPRPWLSQYLWELGGD